MSANGERTGENPREPGEAAVDPSEIFDRHRPLLFSIAYRVPGSVMDADDVVQEAYLRWQPASEVRSPKAYLSAVVARLCIDQLRSARAQREGYVLTGTYGMSRGDESVGNRESGERRTEA